MTSAADVDVEPIWATLLAKALEGKNVKELLSSVGSGGGAPAAGSAVIASSSSGPAEAAAEVEEKKEEEKEESDEDMVCGIVRLATFSSIVNILFTMSRASDFSINLLYYIQFEELIFVACPMWNFKGTPLSPSDRFEILNETM